MLRVIIPPALEPVSVEEFKLHARIDHTDEDTLIAQYIQTAREHVEVISGRSLITQTLLLGIDDWFYDGVELLRPPVQSVTAVRYRDVDGVQYTMSTSDYIVDTDDGMVALKKGASFPNVELWPYSPVEIEYVAGYGSAASSVPLPIRQAIQLLAAHFYENREAALVERGANATILPFAVNDLLAPFRVWGF